MTSYRLRRLPHLVLLLLAGLVVTGCGPTMGDLPLPGSGVSGDTVTVKVRFDEALNLAQGAKVKVNGVDSGKVQSVKAVDFKALATMKVKTTAHLRSNATARLRYTTPLGELFVDVTNPAEGPLMKSGDELGLDRSSTAPTVEDALASASLLINGGGLAQLQTVTTELNKAIGGREDKVRSVLQRGTEFMTQANATTGDFLKALDSLARLSKTLDANKSTINAALRDLAPAARVLRENTPAFTRLLTQVNAFAATANRVVGSTRKDLLTMLAQISPILDEFLANKNVLGASMNALVGASKVLDKIVPGDYTNLLLEIRLDQTQLPLIGGLGAGSAVAKPSAKTRTKASPGALGGIGQLIPQLSGVTDTVTGLLGDGSGSGGDSSGGGLLGGLLGGS